MNEVAGGRKLLEAVRERVDAGRRARSPSPRRRTSRSPGQIVDRDEVRDAALSRVEVTQAVLREFGIEAVGRGHGPGSRAGARRRDPRLRARARCCSRCLYDTRFGLTRKDLVEWAKQRFEVPITHIPVRIEDDAVRWDVTHTLVVATQTVASADLIAASEAQGAPSSRTATRSSARPRARSPARRSASASPARSPSSTGPRSTRPASR